MIEVTSKFGFAVVTDSKRFDVIKRNNWQQSTGGDANNTLLSVEAFARVGYFMWIHNLCAFSLRTIVDKERQASDNPSNPKHIHHQQILCVSSRVN